jgi:regulatory protein
MKILSIKKDKKHLDRIVLEDGTELLIDSDLTEAKKLSSGIDISDPEALKYESDYIRAKSRALWYLSRSDHSEKALKDKLMAAGFDSNACEEACERMAELDLINDERYARRLVEYLSASGSSKREIAFKLSSKGISSDIARQILLEDESDEGQKILMLIERKYKNKLSNEADIEKVFAALIRKGFSFSDVRAALKDYSEQLKFSEEI